MKFLERIRLCGGREIYYYDARKEREIENFALQLYNMVGGEMESGKWKGVLFLCIGTDRSTGDSLGPLIGYKLKGRRMRNAKVVGTLEKPVHAMNLDLYARYIRLHYPDYVVVAIDASVGSLDHVGYATLGRGALQPGLGVSKELQAVGDIAITGIVGGVGSRDPVMLQSVRLSMVMKMADCICESIFLVERLWENAAII